jgi:hypothetical protein
MKRATFKDHIEIQKARRARRKRDDAELNAAAAAFDPVKHRTSEVDTQVLVRWLERQLDLDVRGLIGTLGHDGGMFEVVSELVDRVRNGKEV